MKRIVCIEGRDREVEVLPALTLRQPWAWAVVHGGKDVENRRRNTGVRGTVVIHASTHDDPHEYRWACEWMRSRGLPDMAAIPRNDDLPRGVLVGTAELVDVIEPGAANGGRWHMENQFGFRLRNPSPIVRKPWRGMPGWFYVPASDVLVANADVRSLAERLSVRTDSPAIVCVQCRKQPDHVTASEYRSVLEPASYQIVAYCHGAKDVRTFTDDELAALPAGALLPIEVFR